mmetsp:Transcript_72613/g.193693  ORF Transcript_72613/g.193693 Transcript_72613/m.193693 type:complete len:205 (+) Transcript_72613:3380-3994(+)
MVVLQPLIRRGPRQLAELRICLLGRLKLPLQDSYEFLISHLESIFEVAERQMLHPVGPVAAHELAPDLDSVLPELLKIQGVPQIAEIPEIHRPLAQLRLFHRHPPPPQKVSFAEFVLHGPDEKITYGPEHLKSFLLNVSSFLMIETSKNLFLVQLQSFHRFFGERQLVTCLDQGLTRQTDFVPSPSQIPQLRETSTRRLNRWVE